MNKSIHNKTRKTILTIRQPHNPNRGQNKRKLVKNRCNLNISKRDSLKQFALIQVR